MGAKSRSKGHTFEREVAGLFRSWGFHDAKRHLEYQSQEATGIDVEGVGPFSVQTKHIDGPINPLMVLDEVQGPCRIAVIKRTNRGWYVALSPEAAELLFKTYAKKTESSAGQAEGIPEGLDGRDH